jgi:hypothetical protein
MNTLRRSTGSEHAKLSLLDFFEQGFVAPVINNISLAASTRAMAAKVTERVWEIDDIVDVLEAWEYCFENVRDPTHWAYYLDSNKLHAMVEDTSQSVIHRMAWSRGWSDGVGQFRPSALGRRPKKARLSVPTRR